MSVHTILRESEQSGIPKILFYTFWYDINVKGKKGKKNNLKGQIPENVVLRRISDIGILHHFFYPRSLLAHFLPSVISQANIHRLCCLGSFLRSHWKGNQQSHFVFWASIGEDWYKCSLNHKILGEERVLRQSQKHIAHGGNTYHCPERWNKCQKNCRMEVCRYKPRGHREELLGNCDSQEPCRSGCIVILSRGSNCLDAELVDCRFQPQDREHEN